METNHIYGKPEGTPDNVNCPLCGYVMEQTAGLDRRATSEEGG